MFSDGLHGRGRKYADVADDVEVYGAEEGPSEKGSNEREGAGGMVDEEADAGAKRNVVACDILRSGDWIAWLFQTVFVS